MEKFQGSFLSDFFSFHGKMKNSLFCSLLNFILQNSPYINLYKMWVLIQILIFVKNNGKRVELGLKTQRNFITLDYFRA